MLQLHRLSNYGCLSIHDEYYAVTYEGLYIPLWLFGQVVLMVLTPGGKHEPAVPHWQIMRSYRFAEEGSGHRFYYPDSALPLDLRERPYQNPFLRDNNRFPRRERGLWKDRNKAIGFMRKLCEAARRGGGVDRV